VSGQGTESTKLNKQDTQNEIVNNARRNSINPYINRQVSNVSKVSSASAG